MEQNQQVFKQMAETVGIFRSIDTQFLSEAIKIADTQLRLIDDKIILSSPLLEIASTVNRSLERLLAIDTKQISEIFVQTIAQSNASREQLRPLDEMAENLRHYDLIWRSHLIDISRFSILSETLLSRFTWEQLGGILAVSGAVRDNLQHAFMDFSQSYSLLFKSVETSPIAIVTIPPIIFSFPLSSISMAQISLPLLQLTAWRETPNWKKRDKKPPKG
jgi:hypothetical protein